MKSKKAISPIISYVLLIVIAVSVSTLVYSYLRTYIPAERPECPADTKLIVESAYCFAPNQTLTLVLSNRGLFNVSDAFIRLGPVGRTVREQVNQNQERFAGGPIAPSGSSRSYKYNVSHIVETTTEAEYIIEIQPAIRDNTGIYPCSESIVTQTVMCTSTPPQQTPQENPQTPEEETSPQTQQIEINRINEDGHILLQADNTYQKVNTLTEIEMIGDIISTPKKYGYIEWDTSQIPDEAIIEGVELRYNGLTSANPTIEIKGIIVNRPTSATAQNLFAEIGTSGVKYNSGNQNMVLPGQNTIVLGGGAQTNLQNSLANDWFAIGLFPKETTLSQITATESTNQPTLIVNYTT